MRSLQLPWILLAGAVLLILISPIPAGAATHQSHTFQIVASQYSYSPAVLRVKQGDIITIELTSQDVLHGLSIDGMDVNLVAEPGQTVRATFTAERQGSFNMRCTVTCGAMHPFMIGKLKVGTNLPFWLAGGLFILAFLAVAWRNEA